MFSPTPERRRGLIWLVLLCAVCGAPAVASAHSATGRLTVLQVTPTRGLSVHFEVAVSYTDGDAADAAAVNVLLTDRDNQTAGPVVLSRTSPGRYTGDVDLPEAGTWQATFTSTHPAATARRPIDVGGRAAATTAASTSSTVPFDEAPLAAERPRSGRTALLLVSAGVVAIGAGAGTIIVRRRRRQ